MFKVSEDFKVKFIIYFLLIEVFMSEYLSKEVLHQITSAAAILRDGGIVAFPTDYHIWAGANIDNIKR